MQFLRSSLQMMKILRKLLQMLKQPMLCTAVSTVVLYVSSCSRKKEFCSCRLSRLTLPQSPAHISCPYKAGSAQTLLNFPTKQSEQHTDYFLLWISETILSRCWDENESSVPSTEAVWQLPEPTVHFRSLSTILPERGSDKPTCLPYGWANTQGAAMAEGRESCPHCNKLPTGSPGLFSISALHQAGSSSSLCLSCLKTNNQTQM